MPPRTPNPKSRERKSGGTTPGEKSTCAICFSPFEGRKKAKITTICSHEFHYECLAKLHAQTKCPMCRQEWHAAELPNPLLGAQYNPVRGASRTPRRGAGPYARTPEPRRMDQSYFSTPQ